MNAQPRPVSWLALPAAEPRSQEVTDWAARIGWVVGLLLFVALLYWLMRQGWKWRGTLQGDLPEPAVPPASDGTSGEALLQASGRYHGSTTAGQWLDRIVAHGLGTRSRVLLTLSAAGVTAERPGARDFFVPVERLRGARLEKGIAGKVLTEGGLLVITWELGDRLLDSGFRLDHPAEQAGWVERLTTPDAARDTADVSARADGPAQETAPAGDSAVTGPYRHAVTPERDT
ncbi:hypothetical protein ACFPA8_12720 [Streptomyces ovatisporus]|uniref:PH domain-containing protein n=1 Tax=Streptomyces ovatisporus TaxID=1128682 RepID=A0ABV9A7U8_9ACTN